MPIRDRIQELRRVTAAELQPNPRNWRIHPMAQRARLQAILLEVGYADALLARELPDGTLELVDGHLRADLSPDQQVPVLVLDVTEAEADKLLAVIDPLAALAETDEARLRTLLQSIDWEEPELAAFGEQLAGSSLPEPAPNERPVTTLATRFQLVVDCEDEPALQTLFEQLCREGYSCRVLML